LDNVTVSQECVREVRSYANVVWGTAKGSSNMHDWYCSYISQPTHQTLVNGKV
jgi:hypothetical protein